MRQNRDPITNIDIDGLEGTSAVLTASEKAYTVTIISSKTVTKTAVTATTQAAMKVAINGGQTALQQTLAHSEDNGIKRTLQSTYVSQNSARKPEGNPWWYCSFCTGSGSTQKDGYNFNGGKGDVDGYKDLAEFGSGIIDIEAYFDFLSSYTMPATIGEAAKNIRNFYREANKLIKKLPEEKKMEMVLKLKQRMDDEINAMQSVDKALLKPANPVKVEPKPAPNAPASVSKPTTTFQQKEWRGKTKDGRDSMSTWMEEVPINN